MKRSSFAAIAVFSFLAVFSVKAASVAELLALVPSDSSVVVGSDIGKVIAMPFVKESRQHTPELERQFKELETKLAARHLTITDMLTRFVVFSNDKTQFAGILASTNMGEANLEALLKGEIFSSPPSDYSVETIEGHKTYVLRGQKPAVIPGKDAIPAQFGGQQFDKLLDNASGKTVAMTFLSKDVLLIINMQSYAKYFTVPKSPAGGLRDRMALIDTSSPVWGVFELPPKNIQQGNYAPNSFYDRITGVVFSLNDNVMPKEDVAVRLAMECTDDAAAAMAVTQMQQIIFAMSFASSKNQQSPVAEILSTVTLDNKGKFALVDFRVNRKVLEGLSKPSALAPQPPAPLPGGNAGN